MVLIREAMQSDERLGRPLAKPGLGWARGRLGGGLGPGPQEGPAQSLAPGPGPRAWGGGSPLPLPLPPVTAWHAHPRGPLHMRLSGHIWVVELDPIISFAPSILSALVLSGELFCSLPSFSCRRMFVADEQGVFLKAAGCPVRPPFHLGGPASWAGTKLPAVEFFFLHKNSREEVSGSPRLPWLLPGAEKMLQDEVREVIVTRPLPPPTSCVPSVARSTAGLVAGIGAVRQDILCGAEFALPACGCVWGGLWCL